jgi:hypothetical protein
MLCSPVNEREKEEEKPQETEAQLNNASLSEILEEQGAQKTYANLVCNPICEIPASH